MISAEQFAEWKTHPVTIEIFDKLKEMRAAIVEQMSYGNTIGGDAQSTHGFTNRAVGQILGLDQLLNISYDDKEIEESVNEQSGY